MSLQTITRAITCIRAFCTGVFIFSLVGVVEVSHAGWNVDMSRRSTGSSSNDAQAAPSTAAGMQAAPQTDKGFFDKFFNGSPPMQDIVILNTNQGFIPSTVRVREGSQYRIVVVNVNENAKNVSFILDAFSEHHGTFYGKIKSFFILPKKEGVFTFSSPETSAQGRLVVHPALNSKEKVPVAPALPSPLPNSSDVTLRQPAGEG